MALIKLYEQPPKGYIDITPVMTSNTTPEPYVVTTTDKQGSFKPYFMYNGTVDGEYDSHVWYGKEIHNTTLDFATQVKPDAMTLTSRGNDNYQGCNIKEFKIYGSNDNVNFTELLHVPEMTQWAWQETRFFKFTKTGNFRYYKFEVIRNFGDNNTSTGELRYLQTKSNILIKQDNKFYSINEEFYDQDTGTYNPLPLSDFSKGFNINELFNETIIASTSFIPIEKFNNFQIVAEDVISIIHSGLKSNLELIVANGDIATSIAHNIDFFNLSSIGNIKLVLSIDSGSTWKTWNGIEFANIDCIIPNTSYNEMTVQELVQWNQAKEAIYTQGIGITTFNTLNFNLLNASKIRFAYVLSRPSYSDTVETSQLDWQFDAKGNLRKMTDSECVIDVYERSVKITSSISNELIKANVMV